MKEKTNWPRLIGVGFLGAVIFSGIFILFFLGGAVGAYLYLKNAPIKATITYPVVDTSGVRRNVTINLATEKAIPMQDIDAMMKQGQIRGVVQLTGPGDGKLLAAAFTVQMPMDQIVKETAVEVRKEMGLSQDGDMTKALVFRLKKEMGLPDDKDFAQGFISIVIKQLLTPSSLLPR